VKESLSPEAILMKENILKEKLLAEEQEANRFTMEVRPEYLVVDTNAFVDYLKEIERLINSQKFIILIPTIVIAELKFLSTSARSAATFLPAALDDPSEAHEKYVLEHAKQALTFLRKAADNRSPSFSTVTSKGDRLPNITFAAENLGNTEDKQVNDDHILNACIELSKKKRTATNEAEASSTSPLERSVVLLTEDRALSIKAMAARIPVRTVPKFMKWCGV
jgi:rRNA-processing protein FCF1